MGVSVMILGVSGTGKSTSMRNFKPDDIALVNVAGKPLPFKGHFNETIKTDSYAKIEKFIKETDKNSIVIDDAQYLMADEYMRRALEKGYDKFSEMAKNFYDLLKCIQEDLPDQKIVYLLGHTEKNDDGFEKFKTMGKLIDEKINVEATCTIVLKTCVSDGQYTFLTQNDGKDTVKSPMGMFPTIAIDNDLKYVDEKIRNYYEFDDAVSDHEMAEKDEAAKTDVEPKKRTSRKKRKEAEEEPAPADDFMNIPEDADDFMNIPEDADEEVPFDEILTEDTYFFIEADSNYVMKHAGDVAPAGGKVITKEEFIEGAKAISDEENKPATRRTRRKRAAE